MISNLMKSLFFIGSMALLAGCGGGGTSSATGTLQVHVTDAKVDEAQAVVVHYTAVQIHGDTFDTTVDVTDPLTGDPGRSINLLDYTNGNSTQLFDQELQAGNYQWMRLMVDLDQSYIKLKDGSEHPLVCNSCQKNGLKLNRDFTIAANQTTSFTLDFDLRSSITLANGIYRLRPTVRVVATDASGDISGTVSPTVISTNDPDGNGCAVYVFNGSNATLDDVYVPLTGSVTAEHNNPVTTTMVEYDAQATTYIYTTAFLTPGDYTVALTCDPELDMTATDEIVDTDMTFVSSQNATVTSGMTTTVDFN